MPTNRLAIPENIKRSVRQRCAFGCVICGMQPYDYEHMIEHSQVKEHTEENLTLLCSHHHAEKTRGNLKYNELIKFNEIPYNIHKKISKSRYLFYGANDIVEVEIGGSVFKYNGLSEGFEFIPLQIDGDKIISFTFEDGMLLLSFVSYDLDNN